MVFETFIFWIQCPVLLFCLCCCFLKDCLLNTEWYICNFASKGTLHLDQALHTEVALLVLEAYQKHLSQKPYTGLISESMKQVLPT